MKIDRAQELLEFIRGDLRNGPHFERVKAVELGIEALKRVQLNRQPIRAHWREPLLGETED